MTKKKRKQSSVNKKAEKRAKQNISLQKEESISTLCNVVGIKQNEQVLDPSFAKMATQHHEASQNLNSQHVEDDLDDCLALMDQTLYNQSDHRKVSEIVGAADNDSEKKKGNSPVLKSMEKVLWKGQNGTTINIRNQTKTLSAQTALTEFTLPNIQIELARHKHMGELSQFLLSKCPKLRMPSFERWLIDSKLEERAKRSMIEETNQQIQMADETARNHQNQQIYHKKSKEIKWKQRLKRKRDELKSSLDRHLTSSGMRTLNDYDCVIPSMADVEDEATKRLMQEIFSSLEDSGGGDANENEDYTFKAKTICKELCQKACSAGRHVQNLNQHLGGPLHVSQYFSPNNTKKSTAHSIGRILLEKESESSESTISKDSTSTYSLVYSRKNKKENDAKPFVVKINAMHYEKLRDMYHSIHDSNHKMRVVLTRSLRREKDYDAGTKVFLHLVFCMLVRYASLSGGQQLLDLRGGGMQGAIHSQVFDTLSDLCGSNSIVECFASPLNVYSNQYCSMFHKDIDFHFGSIGDFFSLPLGYFKRHGGNIHEVNPPFSPGLMDRMIKRLEEHLDNADLQASKGNGNGELSFVVVVPTCTSSKRSKESNRNSDMVHSFASESFSKMVKSKYFTKNIILKARAHGYVEGSQHLRNTRYKESQYNTSVVILQSKKSKARESSEPIMSTNAFEDAIRESFSSLHRLETKERRLGSVSTKRRKSKK